MSNYAPRALYCVPRVQNYVFWPRRQVKIRSPDTKLYQTISNYTLRPRETRSKPGKWERHFIHTTWRDTIRKVRMCASSSLTLVANFSRPLCSVRKVVSRSKFIEQIFTPLGRIKFPNVRTNCFPFSIFAIGGRNPVMPAMV